MRKLANIFLTLSIVFFIMWLLFRWHYYQSFTKEKIEAAFEPITSKYGIKIVYEIGDDFFSPLKNSPVPGGLPRYSNVKSIRHRALMRYPDILQKALNKYPIEVIKKNLNAIYFAGEIDIAGDKAGGTYDQLRKILYIVDIGPKNEIWPIHVFHHEFSSLLMRNNSFWIDRWIDHNPKDLEYLDDIYGDWRKVEKVRKTIKDTDCFEKGIVTNYGITNVENDFNEYSAMIFTYPEKFKKIMNQYPRVRSKFKVWLEFYRKIDPIFTEEYLFGKNGKAGK